MGIIRDVTCIVLCFVLSYRVCNVLMNQLPHTVNCYCLARDEGRGKAAVEELKKSGVSPKFFPLDITNAATVENLKKHLHETYGGLDILVNNAGMAYKVC